MPTLAEIKAARTADTGNSLLSVQQARQADTQGAATVGSIGAQLEQFQTGASVLSAAGQPSITPSFPSDKIRLAQGQPETTFDDIAESITGNKRTTPEIEGLKGWQRLPELNRLSVEMAKVTFGGALADTDELAQIIRSQFPNIGLRRDEKGNYIFKSEIDGKEYAIKPGITLGDIPRAAFGVAAFAPSKAIGIGRLALRSAGVESVNQAVQSQSGGEFDAEQIPLAGALEIGGGLVGRTVSRAIKGAPTPTPLSSQQVAVGEAEGFGIDVLTSDIRPPTTFAGRTAQGFGEKIPLVGTGPVRAAQEVSRVSAIRNFLDDFGANYSGDITDRVAADLVADLSATRRAAINNYKSVKDDIFARVASSGPVPMSKTLSTIDTEIARLESLNLNKLTPAISALKDWRNAVQNQDIINIEALRKQLGETFTDPELASTLGSIQKGLNKIYGSVRDDIGDYIKINGAPQDFTNWRVANARLSESVNELGNSALRSVLKSGDITPEGIDRLLFSQKRSDVATLYRNLSEEGRATARAAILHRAMVKAGGEDISPVKFASQVSKLGNQIGVFFNGRDLSQARGLARALELTSQASRFALNPPTGGQLAIPVVTAILTDMLGGMGAGLATGASLGATARIYESKAVRNALLALSRAKPAQEAAVYQALIAALQSVKSNISTDDRDDNGK